MLKFHWNGIKDDGGKLQTCHYVADILNNHPACTITIYKREYSDFSAGVREAFKVHDETDTQTDYIVQEYIRVEPSHPLYGEVYKAWKAQEEHHAKKSRKHAALYQEQCEHLDEFYRHDLD